MLKLKQLTQYLNTLLPSQGVTDFGPNGLQIEGKEDIKKIGTAVSASWDTIQAAAEAKMDVLIVHHGLFWQKDSYVIQGVKRDKIALLLDRGISLFAYHLPLDMHPQLGNNWRAAQEMGWIDLSPFGYLNGIPIGVKGLIKKCSQKQFKEQLEEYYQHPATCALGGPKEIENVALISGGAYRNIEDAIQAGVDAFVTGNFDEPAWNQAFECHMNFFALGHSATERIGPRALAAYLAQEFSISSEFIDIFNPF